MGLPSFFKILIGDFKSVLRLPQLFVEKFGDVFPEKAVLETKYGESWSIKIEQIDESYCFTHGWPQFVQYYQLELCDLLIFSPSPEGKFIFRVSIFGPTACEKEITFGTTSTYSSPCNSESDQGNIVIDLEDTGNSSTSNTLNGRDGNSSKRSSMMKCKSTSNRAEYSDDFVTERSQRIVVCLRKYNKNRMVVPIKFARENGIIGKKNLRLVNSKGETWSVGLVLRRNRSNTILELASGWPDFWKRNKLKAGRKCALEFIPGSDCFRVELLGNECH